MRWHSLRGRFRECPESPYLLDGSRGAVSKDLLNLGFESVEVSIADAPDLRELTRRIGTSLGYPADFRGGWDAFMDILDDHVVSRERSVAMHLTDAGDLHRRDVRLFVRSVWRLMESTATVEVNGAGKAQLEFLFWGDWA